MQIQTTNLTAPGQSTTLHRASNQWRERPADQRFGSIEALRARAHEYRAAAQEHTLLYEGMDFSVADGDVLMNDVPMTSWAFGQLCSKIDAPAHYLRKLPTEMAAECIKHGMAVREDEEQSTKLLIHSGHIQALTSQRYVRVWNAEIADWLCDVQERQPWWSFPVAFQQAGGGQKANAWGERKELPVAFLSDRDMFVFLCDYQHPIQIPGQDTPLTRGFWIENSEVGAGAIRLTMFLFDFVCSNVLVWGARNVIEVKVRHMGNARERTIFDDSEMQRAIIDYSNRSATADVQRIASAQKLLVADTKPEAVSWLYSQRSLALPKTTFQEAIGVAERTPRYGNPLSVWAIVNGLTEMSQKVAYADERASIDRAAGKLLDLTVPMA